MKTYRAAVIGCSRMGAFIDNEVPDYEAIKLPYSHAAGYFAEERIDLVACADLRPEVMEHFGNRYNVPKANQYTDYRDMLEKEQPDIVSVATQPEHRAEIVYLRSRTRCESDLCRKGDGSFYGRSSSNGICGRTKQGRL